MKKILALAACLVLVAALALPAFATDFTYDSSTGEFTGGSNMGCAIVTDEILSDGAFSVLITKSSGSTFYFDLVFPWDCPVYLTGIATSATDLVVTRGTSSGIVYNRSDLPLLVAAGLNLGTGSVPNTNAASFSITWGTATSVKLTFSAAFTPDLSSASLNTPVAFVGTYGIYDTFSREITSDVALQFSNVVGTVKVCSIGSDGTVTKSVEVSSGDVVDYDDFQGVVYVGRPDQLYNGFSWDSYSFTVTPIDPANPPAPPAPPYDFEDGLFGIVGGLADSMFTAGSSLISWATTGSNFIVLIPLSLFVLVAVVLFIRKLIKGV